MLKIYNTLSKQKEEFKPINPEKVGMYVCGMTVYDYCHMGHARVLVMFDVIVRHLRRHFPQVEYVRNITDIDDKIIKRAVENKEDIYSLTNRFINAMHEDERALSILPPDIEPRATDAIDQMFYMIKSLIEKGIAYQGKNGDVYYSVRKFKNYGKLSGKNLDELEAGARVDVETSKQDPLDFVLWKMAKPNEPSWQSPWGDGRPGWHIECSAMSCTHLGKHFDIHGGGMDLAFPHHENEIAQSEGANDCTFVNTWMHVGFVNINNEKMSKSLNNFFTIRGVLENYDGETLRYFIMSSHYRSPLNFSDENLDNAKASLTRLYTATRGLSASEAATEEVSQRFDYEARFTAALDDDFNTPIALSILFELAKVVNAKREKDSDQANALGQLLKKLGGYIGILQMDADTFLKHTPQGNTEKRGVDLSDTQIDAKIEKRNEARNNKDFNLSDQIRDELAELGIILEDNKNGTNWRCN
ncbi:Cysteinyl-tRNA synthetase (EC 6.1.1.16) [uncultured Gammaproteobacteria bacterium]|jgi:cysteinyl-tRNA synthetase|uniref:Cysteine--tRNA ligase n=1 Tax=Bathymodiolus azoricus thioautotrophic gill symbiont TaxID=235205 RepID=A0A1H6MAN2_9GAMM|nr:cysteine--tRNA ligase [Bathymodiolus azoricus thioautotrophic gill symbiont]CAC9498575.1 Cysteinyl-tRNA synthetase (EC 6.1.1.16) [uncultured Gammaproteobacteria bacterium]CAC9525102.1 Cysteinyl-tRNA synthetase (EC 6.1.1.16) [uncultured Gammaproteobacteria bacterium]SEH95973.1 cysteinyl-tRNA synthetase [Bathymodiolus azoricus thioautotrophic gill symbiont]